MMTVREVSEKTGVSVRTLRYYDGIGLLKPARVSDAGYRLYDTASLERLQLILLFRELQFPLKDIRGILDSPTFDRNRALEQQIELLTLRREHLDNLITLARGIRLMGVNHLTFEPFDMTRIDEYIAESKNSWGETDAWKDYERRREGRSREQELQLGEGLMALLAGFHDLKDGAADAPEALAQVRAVRDYIDEHFYACTPEILHALGVMYAGGGSMSESIDAAGGEGTAAFAARAIEAYLDNGGRE